MKILIELEYWQAVRLKALVEQGHHILDQQDRTQYGIDGYTRSDLNKLGSQLLLEDNPKFAKPVDIVR